MAANPYCGAVLDRKGVPAKVACTRRKHQTGVHGAILPSGVRIVWVDDETEPMEEAHSA